MKSFAQAINMIEIEATIVSFPTEVFGYGRRHGDLYAIEKGICKDILNSNKLSRNIDFESVREKVLFPYNDENKPKALEEEFLQDVFPEAYKYLMRKKEELSKRDKGNGRYNHRI